MSRAYNLVDESWIPVVYVDGRRARVSLKALFGDAPRIRLISGEMPQTYFALLRLALAILYRAYDFSGLAKREVLEEWKAIWNQKQFDLDIVEGYLDDCHGGFDLLDQERPFYQVAGLSYVGKECDSVAELVPDVPKPEKYLFAMRALGSTRSLPCDEAAQNLVLTQAYAPAGIKTPVQGNSHARNGKVYPPKGVVGTGWCGAIGGVFLEGANLFETIMLNWCLWDTARSDGAVGGVKDDIPPWELPSPNPDLSLVEPAGPVSMLTWQSRRVRLVYDDAKGEVTGAIICYGDVTDAVNKQRCETMTAWRTSPQQQKKLGLPAVPWLPLLHDASKALWRGLAPLISVSGDTSVEQGDLRPGVVRWIQELLDARAIPPMLPVSIRAQGMTYGTQNSVFEEGIDDAVDLGAFLFQGKSEAVYGVTEVVGQADKAVGELVKLVSNMELSQGDKRRYGDFGDKGASAAKNAVREAAYDALDQLFRERIARFRPEDDVRAYCDSWRSEIRTSLLDVARSYVDGFGRSMFLEHGGMTAGRALRRFELGLARVLGDALSTADDSDVAGN